MADSKRRKTQYCVYHWGGFDERKQAQVAPWSCDRGDRCGFAHDRWEIGMERDGREWQRPVCRAYQQQGKCYYGDGCKYYHDASIPEWADAAGSKAGAEAAGPSRSRSRSPSRPPVRSSTSPSRSTSPTRTAERKANADDFAAIIVNEAETRAKEIRQEAEAEAKDKAAEIIREAEEKAAGISREIEDARDKAVKIIQGQEAQLTSNNKAENKAANDKALRIIKDAEVKAEKAATAKAAIIIQVAKENAIVIGSQAQKLCDDAAKAGTGNEQLLQLEKWIIDTLLET